MFSPEKPNVIFDLDGTLADCAHRVHLAQSKEWEEFQSLSTEDLVIVDVADLLRLVSVYCNVIILTGRNERYRSSTIQWLEEAGLDGFYDELIMRPDRDFRQDAEYKIQALMERFGTKEGAQESIWFAIDDRDTVVEAFRNFGITTFQPAISGY